MRYRLTAKKFLCFTIAVAFLLAGFPFTAFAEPDSTPPEFAGGYPQVQPLDIGTRSVEVTIEAQEAAHYVLVLLPNDATPPTKEQVQSGKDGDGNDALHSAASGMAFPTHAVTVTAPEHSTPYDIYVVLRDEAGNLSEPATLDATTPSAVEYFVLGFPKTGTAQPAGSKTVQVQAKLDINEETEGTTTGWVHYVMVPDGADAPSVSQVLAHKDSSGNDPVDSGTAETVDDTVQSFTVFGSADLTDYDLYMVAESIGEDHLERCTEVVKLDVKTPVAASYVCQVSGKGSFTSLQDALSVVEDGQTITLLTDITVNEPIYVDGINIILNLNGRTLTVDTTGLDGSDALGIANGGSIDLFGDSGQFNICGNQYGVHTTESSTAKVTNASGGKAGVYAGEGCTVNVLGDAKLVTGSPTVSDWAVFADKATVTVHGDVEGANGVTATGVGANVTVFGNVTAKGNSPSYKGVAATDHASVTVKGNVHASDCIPVSARGAAEVQVEGMLATSQDCLVEAGETTKGADDYEKEPISGVTKEGYRTYYDSATESKVWVKSPLLPGVWYRVGGTGVPTDDFPSYVTMAVAENGTPYVAYCDVNDGYKPTVWKYIEGTGWELVGGGRVSEAHTHAAFLSLQVYNGVPYLAYTYSVEGSYHVAVMEYESGEWTAVGSITASNPQYSSLHITDDGTMYLAFLNSYWYSPELGGIITVIVWDPVDNEWDELAAPNSTDRLPQAPLSLDDYDGDLYLAYRDKNDANKAKAKVYDSGAGTWTDLGSVSGDGPVGPNVGICLTDDGTPYVAYAFDDTWTKGCTVVTYDGAQWQQVGGRVSNTASSLNQMGYHDGIPYAAYRNQSDGAAAVQRFVGGEWVYVGTGLSRANYDLDLDMHGGIPYVAYKEGFGEEDLVVMTTIPQEPVTPALTSVTITGNAKFGETLTADVTYSSAPSNAPTLAYQWKRGGVDIAGANGATYVLTQADIGKPISVTVTMDGTNATGTATSAVTAAVAKADPPPAPTAPSVSSKTHNSVTLATKPGCEYSKDGGTTWQDSPIFTGLTPSTEYTFLVRVKETATTSASAPSAEFSVTTNAQPQTGDSGGAPLVITVPAAVTDEVTDITAFGATLSGSVASDGCGVVTERGFVYGEAENPAVDDEGVTKAIEGRGTGRYNVEVTDLKPGTTYHVRAYAINSEGAGYGANVAFTTEPWFEDIEGHWAEDDINFCAARHLFTGVTDTLFAPNEAMTRGMFVTVLGRMQGVNPFAYAGQSFDDVPAGAYYAPFVEWALENGIVLGVSEDSFEPDRPVTRQEMAAMIYRFMEFLELQVPQGEAGFEDVSLIASWALDSVLGLRETGILTGKPGNVFDPDTSSTRGEVAAVLRRLIEYIVSGR